MVVVTSVVARGRSGADESVTVTVVAEAMVEVVPLIMVMVKMYSLMIVLPAGHVDVVATPFVGGALTVTVEPAGHVDLGADAITVTVEAGVEAADAVTVTVDLLAVTVKVDLLAVTVTVDLLAVTVTVAPPFPQVALWMAVTVVPALPLAVAVTVTVLPLRIEGVRVTV